MSANKSPSHDLDAAAQLLRNRIGAKTIKTTINVEVELLKRIDAYALRLGITRGAFMSMAASLVIDNFLSRLRE